MGKSTIWSGWFSDPIDKSVMTVRNIPKRHIHGGKFLLKNAWNKITKNGNKTREELLENKPIYDSPSGKPKLINGENIFD